MTNTQSPTVRAKYQAHNLTLSKPQRWTTARQLIHVAMLIRSNWRHNETFRSDVAFWSALAAVAVFVACLPYISNIAQVVR